MRITSKKNISAYVYKVYPYLFASHPNTIRDKERSSRAIRREKSFFSKLKTKAFYMSFEKYGY